VDPRPDQTPEELLEDLRARRHESSLRRKRRTRFIASGLVAAAVVAATAFLLLSGGSGDQPEGTDRASGKGVGKAAVTDPDRRDRTDWQPFEGPVPILMYHPIEEPVPGNPYPDLFLTKEDFADQIRWLDRSGYVAVTLEEVLDGWFEEGSLPPKPIVLSFDDGYVSQYENAFSLMEKRGWPGVLNLKAGETDIYDRQVREMVLAGWEIASHTVTHPDLTTVSGDQLEQELVRSRRILQRKFNTPVTNFCYPAGRYDDRVIAAVKKAGYRSATSTESGLARRSDLWSLDRIRIQLGDDAARLESKLASAGA